MIAIINIKEKVRGERLKDHQIVWNRKMAEVVPGLERTPEGRNDNPLQYSCLENPIDKGVSQSMKLQRVGQD